MSRAAPIPEVGGEENLFVLEKNAEDVKGGAGQYFTPRSLIRAMVQAVRPRPGESIGDPACGTGGFFLGAYNYLEENYKLDRDQQLFLKTKTFRGTDIVDGVVRLCAMNLHLHGIGGEESPISVDDSLLKEQSEKVDIVLTNPPFGKKSSVTISNGGAKESRQTETYSRQDFWATTSNKQLNFPQHLRTMLKTKGRAAIVVPDNVLFEGGAGETVRRRLLKDCYVHTLLRLSTGVFYAQGVKANVLFFDRRSAGGPPPEGEAVDL